MPRLVGRCSIAGVPSNHCRRASFQFDLCRRLLYPIRLVNHELAKLAAFAALHLPRIEVYGFDRYG